MELGYKMILNLPDLRLMENKKELEEFPSRKKQKADLSAQLHSQATSALQTTITKKRKTGLYLPEMITL